MSDFLYLRDKNFLKEIDNLTVKILTARVTILSWDEKPLMDFTGKILPGGTENLDGTSNMRRTCNISLSLEDDELNITKIENVISINKKIKLEIGVYNTTNNSKYKDYNIIWFPLGIFIIIQPNISRGTNGTTVSLQLKDKMCLLNGEMGGTLPASITFNERSYFDDEGNEIIEHPTVFQIIYELVNHWGGEQLGNIIIEDIDEEIKKVMKWNNPNYPVYMKIEENDVGYNYRYTSVLEPEERTELGWITKNYGEDIGYIYTSFVWPNEELVGDTGNSICDILDKIISILGNYEYFYDVYGRFHFREKRNYLNTTFTTTFLKELQKIQKEVGNDNYLNAINSMHYQTDFSNGKSEYLFNDNFLISSYTNTPQFNMIKNDFIVWGLRKSVDGTTLPIRYHLAIDKKPELSGHLVVLYTDKEDNLKKAAPIHIITEKEARELEDNREIIIGDYYCIYHDAPVSGTSDLDRTKKIYYGEDDVFRVFIDYNKFELDEELNKQTVFHNIPVLSNQNREPNNEEDHLAEGNLVYISESGLIQLVCVDYTLDDYITYFKNDLLKGAYEEEDTLEGYDSLIDDTIKVKKFKPIIKNGDTSLVYIKSRDWRTELYLQGVESSILATDSNYYYTELVNEWPKLYNIEEGRFSENVLSNPSSIDYFLDFIDTDSPMGEFDINSIGRRTRAEVDDKINCVFAPTPLDCVIIPNNNISTSLREKMVARGQRFATVDQDTVYDNLVQGGELNSAFGKIREMLYQYTSYCESITLQALPVYYLEPNTRITVEDPKSNIFGDYIINRITLPLDCNGMMTINATRALERI